MVISIRRWKEWIKFLFLFILFTILLYMLISFLAPFFQPDVENQEPFEGAVQVFADHRVTQPEKDYLSEEVWDRVKLFYLLGE